MKVVVTGGYGFIGKNLCLRLEDEENVEVIRIGREVSLNQLINVLSSADFIYHFAGVNRPKDALEFENVNVGFLETILNSLKEQNRSVPVVLTSSIHATADTPYGKSKLAAEELLLAYGKEVDAPVYIYRLPNVFGKWCRPNYNSVVATFCHNIANDLPITIHDESAEIELVYVDDVCDEFITLLKHPQESGFKNISCSYETTVGNLALMLNQFKKSRDSLVIANVGVGLERALYATYLSYLAPDNFAYSIPSYDDERGVFCEMLKTLEAGQFSFFTAQPNVTRGGHYHHTKNEKFLVVSGKAKFRFQHVLSGEMYELVTSHESFQVVETVPGWTHDVTNVGEEELVVMLWANEVFDREHPDTISRVI
ncbi:UDP-2-acetamido-2,6-beta-L-arabino-hexul-4-ose reductase [Halodesulfovibrio aestuarii]|uniref:UDP-2-acetamido-2,6-beta-L-arabino-hexul-4-ose reductase n=1 Tax=Halodesulfovibrio aestuarii TaxID=126333 RepID=UPI000426875D